MNSCGKSDSPIPVKPSNKCCGALQCAERVERKVIELFDIEKENLYSGSRKKPISEARSLSCHKKAEPPKHPAFRKSCKKAGPITKNQPLIQFHIYYFLRIPACQIGPGRTIVFPQAIP